MKFRIMYDANGRYVQKKNMFGIWRNWLLHSNCTTPLGVVYYEHSADEIIEKVKSSNKIPNQKY